MKPEIREMALDAGVTTEALKKWRQRGAVPHCWRLTLLDAARAKRLKITADDMKWRPTEANRRKAA